MDIYSSKKRSEIMGLVRASDTKPELAIRSCLWSSGYRFSLRRRELPGKPDVVLPKHKAVIFAHGCFWHHHRGCAKSKLPDTNASFWRKKILANVVRDRRNALALKLLGWRVLVIWECEIRSPILRKKLDRFLRSEDARKQTA